MNIWIIATAIVSLLVIAGIITTGLVATRDADNQGNENAETCGQSCRNSCDAGNSCGLVSCGARAGGRCSCGK